MTDRKNKKNTPATPAPAGDDESAGRFAYLGLERLIHERSRLGILSSLAAHPQGLVFNDLKALVVLTDGNLSRQLQLLSEAKFVEVWKGTRNNRPQTLVRLTPSGRKRFLEYIAQLEQVVADASAADQPTAAQTPRRPSLA
jgi:DNA-binding MarR family transcriptional regulator